MPSLKRGRTGAKVGWKMQKKTRKIWFLCQWTYLELIAWLTSTYYTLRIVIKLAIKYIYDSFLLLDAAFDYLHSYWVVVQPCPNETKPHKWLASNVHGIFYLSFPSFRGIKSCFDTSWIHPLQSASFHWAVTKLPLELIPVARVWFQTTSYPVSDWFHLPSALSQTVFAPIALHS